MPPKLTETSTTSSTAWGSRRPVPAAAAKSVAGADKGPLLLEEDGSSGPLGGRCGDARLRTSHADRLAHPLGTLRDAPADAVGVAADAHRRNPGEQELVLQERRQVRQEGREQRERESTQQDARGGVDAADAREQQGDEAQQSDEALGVDLLRDAAVEDTGEAAHRCGRGEHDELR